MSSRPSPGPSRALIATAIVLGCGRPSSPAAPAPAPATSASPAPTPTTPDQDEERRYAGMMLAEDDSAAGSAPGSSLQAQLDEVERSGAEVHAPTPPSPPAPPGPALHVIISDVRTLDRSSLTPDLVRRTLGSAYIPGVRRCYRAELDAGALATVDLFIELDVNESGRAADVTVTPPGRLATCVAALVAQWRFDIPKATDGEPTDARFLVRLKVAPAP